MDLPGILIMPLAAIVTAVLVVAGALVSQRLASLRLAFVCSFVLALALLRPEVPMGEWAMLLLMLVMIGLWVAAGCIFGGITGLLLVATGRRVRLFRRR